MINFIIVQAISAFLWMQGGDSDLPRAIANGYAANREAVDHGKASFIVLEGKAADASAAKKGEFSIAAKAEGKYMFKGKALLYQTLYNTNDMAAATKKVGNKEYSTNYIHGQVLTDGKAVLYVAPVFIPERNKFSYNPIITDDMSFVHSFTWFPLNLGMEDVHLHDIAWDLGAARRDQSSAKVLELKEDESLDGRSVHKLTFKKAHSLVIYWIDYRRGCIPLQVLEKSEDGVDTRIIHYDNIEHVDDRIWFPYRTTVYMFKSHNIKILDVTHFEVEPVPPDNEFELSFAEPITIVDTIKSFRYKNVNSFNIREFKSPGVSTKKDARQIVLNRSAPAPAAVHLPEELKTSNNWMLYATILGSMSLFGLAGYRLLKKR